MGMQINIRYKLSDGSEPQYAVGKGYWPPEQVAQLREQGYGVLQFESEFIPETYGKRVNLETLTLEDCPKFLLDQHNGLILSKIRDAEENRFVRAMLDKEMGDGGAALRKLASDIAELRSQLKKE